MIALEDVRTYLPKYLSKESTDSLFRELSQFPANIDARFYSRLAAERPEILQGDALTDLLLVNLPDTQTQRGNAIIISNTCDIAEANRRVYPSCVCYCPIINLEKYQRSLESSYDATRIGQFVQDVRRQQISQVFYLPKGAGLHYEGFVFFDKVCSCRTAAIPTDNVVGRRLFSLSNFGFYLFLFKLSIHFTRIRESLDRK